MSGSRKGISAVTIAIIKDQINKFVSDLNPSVMAIKGAWGAGKTHSWNQFLKESQSTKTLAYHRYSYVSLFGVPSLDTLKFTIFENTVKRELIGTEPSIDTFRSNAVSLGESLGRNSWAFFKGLPIANWFNPAVQSLSFLSIHQTLICIDDLERKGDGLSVKDILGLISHLKEQKRCKIVILLNNNEEGIEEYAKFKEKVIDIEIQFAPTATECAAIAFRDTAEWASLLREFSTTLNIINIRVLKKIEKLVREGLLLVPNLECEVKRQICHTLTLFTWCYYCSGASDDSVPSLEFVCEIGYNQSGIGDTRDLDETSKRWMTLLKAYDYSLTDPLDLVLASAVRSGYFNENEFVQAAQAKNSEVVASKGQNSFFAAWRIFHESFDNNAAQVVNALNDSIRSNYKHISPANLNGAITLLRNLSEDEKASELIDFYIANRSDNAAIFNVNLMSWFGDKIDFEIKRKFDSVYNELKIEETAKEVLGRISFQNGWNPIDEQILAATSVDEYYQLFKSEAGPNLPHIIYTCLKFGDLSNASEQQATIAKRAKEALMKFAGETRINKLRVKHFGIDPGPFDPI